MCKDIGLHDIMQSIAKLWGVLIADVIRSRGVEDLRAVLRQRLRLANIAHLQERRIRLPYAITAGDEFQTVARRLEEIPSLIFDLRRRMFPLELRIGVGIGEVPGRLRPPVNTLGGEAFQLARTAIEGAKHQGTHRAKRLTFFRSRNESFDRLANLVYGLHDTLIRGISERQWLTITTYSAKRRVDLAARALRVSNSTASRNLKRAHYWEIAESTALLERLIKTQFP